MSDLISRQVLELWNRYKPTIAVDAIEYDRELKKLLGTNLASLGTDLITKQAAIYALASMYCKTDEDGYVWIIRRDAWARIDALPPIQPKRGKWILVTDNNGQHFECNRCGEWRYHQVQKFCGECGAEMEVNNESD